MAGCPTLGGMKRTLLIAAVAALGLTTVAVAPAYAAPTTGAGYVWADNPTSAFYTPNDSYNFNSTDPFDSVNTIGRTEDGIGPLYTVRFPGLGLVGGTVQVTAYGSGSVACQAQGWAPLGDDQLVWVRCFNNAGTAVNSRFTVAYTNIESPADGELAYVWANNATPALHTPYTPSPTYQANSGGGNITITRSATGVYSVHMIGLGNPETTHVQVTPYGTTPARCVTPGWGYNFAGNAQDATVRCYSMDGDAMDTRFTLTLAAETNILGLENCCDPDGNSSAYALVFTPEVNGEFEIWEPSEFTSNPFATGVGNRLGVGRYSVDWYPHISHGPGNVQVTAYSGEATNCKVAYWNNTDGIVVQCYDTDGTATDAWFTLAFTGPYQVIET
jgi:hypothetical protein